MWGKKESEDKKNGQKQTSLEEQVKRDETPKAPIITNEKLVERLTIDPAYFSAKNSLRIELSHGLGFAFRANQANASQLQLNNDFRLLYNVFDNCNEDKKKCFILGLGGEIGNHYLLNSQAAGLHVGFLGEISSLFSLSQYKRLLGPYINLSFGIGMARAISDPLVASEPALVFPAQGSSYVHVSSEVGAVVNLGAITKNPFLQFQLKLGVSAGMNPFGDGISINAVKFGISYQIPPIFK